MLIRKKKMKIVRLKRIKIPEYYTVPRWEKYISRFNYYVIHKKYLVPIVVNKDNLLVDGYTSYLIAKQAGKRFVKVEVSK